MKYHVEKRIGGLRRLRRISFIKNETRKCWKSTYLMADTDFVVKTFTANKAKATKERILPRV